MRPLLATLAAFLGVPILGAVLGLIQLGWYHARVRSGGLSAQEVPFFGALLLRGMTVAFIAIAGIGIVVNLQHGTAPTVVPAR